MFTVDDVANDLIGSDRLFHLAHLAEGFEGRLHEIGEGAGLAVVYGVEGECIGDSVEVFEDGGVVLHVNEAYEGDRVPGEGGMGLETFHATAAIVHEAEVVAVKGGHGAAGAAEAEMTAARIIGGFEDP